ncbi:phosphomannomutase/phosphoglucomutase [uncultured Umboniibacter sp.]|uniref:phosphomannomutase/phosphoglucomutase n=1 Tax=uncultured Umboniibacter sp. TaxID=1798917 RepID=UPI00261F9A69|nr:phosphomannomutase/phosphoglucomutase [uncultured Umboniibacter sp.]
MKFQIVKKAIGVVAAAFVVACAVPYFSLSFIEDDHAALQKQRVVEQAQQIRHVVADGLRLAQLEFEQNLAEITEEPLTKRGWNTFTDQQNGVVLGAKLNEVELDDSFTPPISWGDLRMIRAIGKDQFIEPEAFEFNDIWYLRLAKVVTQAGDAQAVAYMQTVPLNYFSELLLPQLSNGRVILLQQLPQGRAQMILSQGAGEGTHRERIRISGIWMAEFDASDQWLTQVDKDYSLVYYALAISALICLLGVVMARRIYQYEASMREESKKGLRKSSTAHDAKWAEVPHHVFRDYDIRGRAEELTDELVLNLGRALGTKVLSAQGEGMYVCRDERSSSPRLHRALIKGILETGCHVVDIGTGPSGKLYYATEVGRHQSGVMITASHNPKDYNGFKIVIGGKVLDGKRVRDIKSLVVANKFASGTGEFHEESLDNEYLERLTQGITESISYKVAVDAGNGIAGPTALSVLKLVGCEPIPLFCDPDGDFPNHDPDPSHLPNLDTLRQRVIDHQADFGIALDGDGDRLFMIDELGQIIMPDKLLMLLARDVCARRPNSKVVFDIKSSSTINEFIERYQGEGLVCKSGHSNVRNKMVQENAILGGELSGHLFIADDWYGFDDGIYAALRIIQLLNQRQQPLSEFVATLPKSYSSAEIRIPVSADYSAHLLDLMNDHQDWKDIATFLLLDGVRVEFTDGWGLVRPSNTESAVTFRFESDTEDGLAAVRQRFYDLLSSAFDDIDWNELIEDLR